MVGETGAANFVVPIPLAFSSHFSKDTRVNAGESTAVHDIIFKGILLGVIQDVAGSVQENDGLVALQILGSKERGIFSGIDLKIVFLGELLHGGNSVCDRVVAKHDGFGKDQNSEWLGGVGKKSESEQRGGEND